LPILEEAEVIPTEVVNTTVLLALFIAVASVSFWWYQESSHRSFGPGHVVYSNAAAALSSLISDLKRATKSVLMLCGGRNCVLVRRPQEHDELINELMKVVRAKHREGVEITVVFAGEAPPTLVELSNEGCVRLVRRLTVPAYARIIDDEVVEIRAEDESTAQRGPLTPEGRWLRADPAERPLRAYIQQIAMI
jgi:hypothetical protein